MGHFVLDLVIEFPMPDEEHRAQMWRQFLPDAAPVDPGIDYDFLARQFRLSGGNIKNIVVSAAYHAAANGGSIAMSHLLPNSLAPVLVQGTLTLATAIIEAAALSFLGLGNPNSAAPEWGVMLADAQGYLDVRPGLAIYPAVAIIITALGFTLLGESMREALDPKLRK